MPVGNWGLCVNGRALLPLRRLPTLRAAAAARSASTTEEGGSLAPAQLFTPQAARQYVRAASTTRPATACAAPTSVGRTSTFPLSLGRPVQRPQRCKEAHSPQGRTLEPKRAQPRQQQSGRLRQTAPGAWTGAPGLPHTSSECSPAWTRAAGGEEGGQAYAGRLGGGLLLPVAEWALWGLTRLIGLPRTLQAALDGWSARGRPATHP